MEGLQLIPMESLRAFLTDPVVREPLVGPSGDRVTWVSTTTGRPAVHVASIGSGEQRTLRPDALSGHPFRSHCWGIHGETVWLFEVPDDNLDRTKLIQVSLSGDVISSINLGGWTWLQGATESGVIISDWDRTVAESGDLFCIDPATGDEEQLTNHGRKCGAVALNTDGRLAYVVEDRFDMADGDLGGNAIIRQTDGSTTVLGEAVRPIAWEGDHLLLASDGEDADIGIRRGDGSLDWLGAGTPLGFVGSDEVLAVREGVPVVVPRDRELSWEYASVLDGSAQDGSGAFVTEGTERTPPRLFGWTGTGTTPIETPEYVVPPVDFPDPDAVTFTDSAGEEREAWLLLPEERPATCLAHLYGAFPERGEFDRKFGRPLQYFREQGYAILVPAHGGEPYSERRHSDYAAAARWASKQDWSDERVVALGHSHGGYDVLMQATHHHDPWVAGVAWNGIADLREFHNVMAKDHEFIERELGHRDLDYLDTLSPALSSDAVGFELLVIEGEHDWIIDQIQDFVANARSAGATIDYEEIKGTGHWTQDLDVQVEVWSRIEAFLQSVIS